MKEVEVTVKLEARPRCFLHKDSRLASLHLHCLEAKSRSLPVADGTYTRLAKMLSGQPLLAPFPLSGQPPLPLSGQPPAPLPLFGQPPLLCGPPLPFCGQPGFGNAQCIHRTWHHDPQKRLAFATSFLLLADAKNAKKKRNIKHTSVIIHHHPTFPVRFFSVRPTGVFHRRTPSGLLLVGFLFGIRLLGALSQAMPSTSHRQRAGAKPSKQASKQGSKSASEQVSK